MMDNLSMSPNDSLTHFSLRGSEHDKQNSLLDFVKPDDRGRQVMIMNVDIGEGRTDEIVVHECDEPDELAKAFCEKYSLPTQIQHALSLQIESNIEQLVEDQCTSYIDESPVKAKPSYTSQAGRYNYRRPVKKTTSNSSMTDRSIESPMRLQYSEIEDSTHNRLYIKGMMMKQALLEETKKRLKEKEREESTELTFSPQIIRRELGRASTEHSSPSVSARLKNKELRLSKLREHAEYKELADCTFKPQLCEVSRLLTQNRTGSASERIHQLYSEAKDQTARREYAAAASIKNTCPFKPAIIDSPSKASVNSSPSRHRRDVTPQKTAVERDPECSFKPKTGRHPKFNRNPSEMAIGAYLYAQKPKRDALGEEAKTKPSQFTGETSLKIIDKLRLDRYELIFKALCTEGSSEVVWDCSHLDSLDSRLIRVLTPFIEELRLSEQTYSPEVFCEMLDKFARKLSPIEKSVLYSTGKGLMAQETMSFKPKITKYSSSNLKARAQLTMYDRLVKDQQRVRSSVNEQKIRRIEKEMQECTFYPNTIELKKSLRSKTPDATDKQAY
jgi:hypothetical protein